MIIISCVDDRKGMLFNGRRQSRDKAVFDDISEMLAGRKLHITPFSEKITEEYGVDSIVSAGFPSDAEPGGLYFAEDISLNAYEESMTCVILYRWNKVYPADRFFDIDLENGGWRLYETCDIKGKSHEKITKEVYRR